MKQFYTLFIILFSFNCLFGQAQFLDSTFSSDGLIKNLNNQTPYSSQELEFKGIDFLSDSSFIVCGSRILNGYFHSGVMLKFSPNGNIDSTFANDGVFIVDSSTIEDMAIWSDGKFIALRNNFNSDNSMISYSIHQYHSNGTVDSTFGDNGKTVIQYGNNIVPSSFPLDRIRKIKFQGNKILVGGSAEYNLIRFLSDGTIDSTFANNGILYSYGGLGGGLHDFSVLSDNKIIIATSSYGDNQVARLHPNGLIDSTFGTNGMTTTPYTFHQQPKVIDFQSDGSIIIAAWSFDYTPMNQQSYTMIYKYSLDGFLDTTFGSNGYIIRNSMFGVEGTYKNLIIQPDDKILIGGWQGYNSMFITRYQQDGTKDINFGVGGEVKITASSGQITNLLLQSDQKIIATGSEYLGDKSNYIIRLKPLEYLLNDDTIPVIIVPIDTLPTDTIPVDTSTIDTTVLSYQLDVFPNPIEDQVQVAYELLEESTINLIIISQSGERVQVLKNQEIKAAGKYIETFTIKDLSPNSIYYLWFDDGKSKVVKLIMKK